MDLHRAEHQVRSALARYAQAIDSGDWDGLGAFIAPDADLDYSEAGGPRTDLATLAEWLADSIGRVPRRVHAISSVVVTPVGPDRDAADGAVVTSVANLVNPLADDTGRVFVTVHGRYHDRWAPRPGTGADELLLVGRRFEFVSVDGDIPSDTG